MKTYAQLFQELDSYSRKFLANQLSKWQAEQAKFFENLDNIFAAAILAFKDPNLQDQFSLWTELDKTFKALNGWIKEFNLDPDNISASVADWQDQIQHFFSSFPQQIESTIEDEYWLKESKEAFFIKLWKFHNRRKIGLKNASLKINNVIRKLFKKSPQIRALSKRLIVTQDFFNLYFTVPFSVELYEIWQKHLQLLTRQLASIHRETEQIVHPLFRDGHLKDILNSRSEPLVGVFKRLNSFSQIHADFQEKYNVFKKETLGHHKDFLTDLKHKTDKNWRYGGTFVLKGRKFNPKKFKSAFSKLEKSMQENNTAWHKHLEGEKSDWQKDNELGIIQLYSGQLCHKTISSLTKKSASLVPCLDDPRRMIENTLQELKTGKYETSAPFKEKVLAINRTLLRNLHREYLPHSADTIVNAQFSKTMENYLSQMENELENLSEKYTIFRTQDLENIPPESKFIEIPLKDIITEEIFSIVEETHLPSISTISSKMDMLIRMVSENDQIIELNFDTALELLESEEENRLEKAIIVATEGLERAANQLHELQEESSSVINDVIESLIKQTLHFEESIQNLSDNEKIIALKIRAEKAKTEDKIRESFSKFFNLLKSAIPNAIKFLFNTLKKIQTIYFRLRKITGLATFTADVEDELSQFLYQTRSQLKKLPFVYQRLFRFQPLDDSRFFAGREEQMEQLKFQLEHWKKGNFAITALVGEKGSGRTTILNFAESEYYSNMGLLKIDLDKTVYQEAELFKILNDVLKIPDCKNIDELEQAIVNKESTAVCVVENLHKMFLRIPDGFDAIEQFMLFISNTHQKIHWVITCGIYSWNYLDKVLNIHRYFHKSILLPELSVDKIKQVILKRHRVSGYKLFFETPAGMEKNRKFKKLVSESDQQNYLNELFFQQLNTLSAGNITVAILFWLSSIREIKEDYLVISPVIEFETGIIQNMARDDLFTFAAFLQHETLSPEQHALIFNQDIQKSLLIFNRMKNKGMLSEVKGGYQVHYLLYRTVVRALKINNLLL